MHWLIMTTVDKAITITVQDHQIAGTLVRPATAIPGVLFVHGWGGSQEQYIARAREIAALGCVCLTIISDADGDDALMRSAWMFCQPEQQAYQISATTEAASTIPSGAGRAV
jgi:dienelactone hydrolase